MEFPASTKVEPYEHQEYPKHVKVGKDKDGHDITKVVQNSEEEKALVPPEAKPEGEK